MEKQFPTHIVAVFGIVENQNHEILLLKHREKSVWMFPGGQVEIGENLVDALIREAKEESNMDITVNKLFSISSNTCTYQGYNGYGIIPTKVVFGFTCTYIGGEFCDSNETTESCWVSKEKVLDYIKVPDFIEKYKAYLQFNGDIQYLEYITKPQYELKYTHTI
ncbi:NUDIX hydrolase [Paludicola sp. MB14-C6]|uniref:NUDIX hydrolase n=1 Tax=Paludihabitans sp. MB14-C6 TaxID=3070656 RepID=UPI0027DD4094|nr:NUDIX hydrolase [Paludicola sp. MB14-C6]WMJ22564.1 NUDIX hydrolase [Paludicola sp. MB14-C6]